MKFTELNLEDSVLQALEAMRFEECTPVQEHTIPIILEGRDLIGVAQTGTGKTAAYLLPVLNQLSKGNYPADSINCIIMSPTRELAQQIDQQMEGFSYFMPASSVAVYGCNDGIRFEQEKKGLTLGADVVIATPGRLISHLSMGYVDLSRVSFFILDEADRMLDMGFIPDVKRIVSMIPRKGERQTLMFSATLDDSILRLSSGWLADPYVVESEPDQLVSGNIEQKFYSVSRDEKLAVTLHILNNTQFERLIIFGNRKDVNLRLQYDLARYGHLVPVLSGDIPQEKRIKILEKFRSGEEKVIIATDVAARGIHVDNVSLVINYDLPERSEDYIHRIGRTGRAGNTGCAISFLCEYGAYYLPAIEELLKTTFPSELPPEEMLVLPPEDPKAKLPSKNGSTSGSGRGNKKPGNFRRRR